MLTDPSRRACDPRQFCVMMVGHERRRDDESDRETRLKRIELADVADLGHVRLDELEPVLLDGATPLP